MLFPLAISVVREAIAIAPKVRGVGAHLVSLAPDSPGELTRQICALVSLCLKDSAKFVGLRLREPPSEPLLGKIHPIPPHCQVYSTIGHISGNYTIIFFDTEKSLFFSVDISYEQVCQKDMIDFSGLSKNYKQPFSARAARVATDNLN
jgi:hypothetical protein